MKLKNFKKECPHNKEDLEIEKIRNMDDGFEYLIECSKCDSYIGFFGYRNEAEFYIKHDHRPNHVVRCSDVFSIKKEDNKFIFEDGTEQLCQLELNKEEALELAEELKEVIEWLDQF